jgi:tRNA(Ile)-lysidine synthase
VSKTKLLKSELVLGPIMNTLEQAPQILVGFSGGLDSTVLLALLAEVIPVERLCAVHVNHGLSPNASTWQAHVEDFCGSRNIACHSETVEVVAGGKGLEAAARQSRYQIFENVLEQDGILLLGHHSDDQVETLLYRLMRGSGAKGMSGMPVSRRVGPGRLIRPLLNWPKSALIKYAHNKNLKWVEDESNGVDAFERNYLRNQLIPVLAHQWPDYRQRLRAVAELSHESHELAEATAIETIATLQPAEERAGWSLSVSLFANLTPLKQKNILRYWPEIKGLDAPGAKIINEVLTALIDARKDSSPKVSTGDGQYCRFRDRLYLLKVSKGFNASINQQQDVIWNTDNPIRLSDGSHLTVEQTVGDGLRAELAAALSVTTRKGGERCKPAGRGHSNSLKKLLQEFNVEPWWRDRAPLFFIDQQLVAVADFWICDGWQAQPGEKSIKIHWHTNSL